MVGVHPLVVGHHKSPPDLSLQADPNRGNIGRPTFETDSLCKLLLSLFLVVCFCH